MGLLKLEEVWSAACPAQNGRSRICRDFKGNRADDTLILKCILEDLVGIIQHWLRNK
jgi:hypothetical protein